MLNIQNLNSMVPNKRLIPYNSSQSIKKEIAKNLLSTFVQDWIALLSHELGHATASKILAGCPFEIHLGQSKIEIAKMFEGLTLGPFIIHSILPSGGWSHCKREHNALSDITISLSGPITGALSYFLINLYCLKKSSGLTWQQIIQRATLQPNIFAHLFRNLIPVRNNDGAKILYKINKYLRNIFYDRRYIVTRHLLINTWLQPRCFKHICYNDSSESSFVRSDFKYIASSILLKMTNKLLCALKYGFKLHNFIPEDLVTIGIVTWAVSS